MKKISVIIKVLIGNAFLAMGIASFAVPARLILGGVTGLSLVGQYLTTINYTYFVYALNIGFFIVGYLYFGKKFAAGTMLSTIAFPFFLSVIENIPQLKMQSGDMLLCCIYAGIFIGIGIGIVFREGFSTGGMDIPPLMLAKKTGIPVTTLINIFDITILLLQASFSSFESILYGILTVLITNYVMDRVLVLGESNYEVFIISDKYEEIVNAIYKEIDRGATFVEITTGYLQKRQKAVMCIVSRRELRKLNEIALAADEEAFLITKDCHSVNGRGFTLENIDK